MAESNIVECMLCGHKAPNKEMSCAGCPVLGHHLDFGMAVKWFCPEPCFETYRNNPGLQKRVWQWQDACADWARGCVWKCEEEQLAEQENLPEGLKITPSDRAQRAVLRDNLQVADKLRAVLRRVSSKNQGAGLYPALRRALAELEGRPEFLAEMGAKITEAENAETPEEGILVLRSAFDALTYLQSDDDNHLMHRICRNINKNQWQHPKTGNFIDYEDTRERFENLERLSPEERRSLDEDEG